LGRTAAACAALGATLVLVAAAQARSRTNPILSVAFAPDGSVSVTTTDGMTVGTSSGTPTVIPAGYYTLLFSGIRDCGAAPYFRLDGPGVSVVSQVNGEPNPLLSTQVRFLPASTYSWSDAGTPGAVYQFTTSSQMVGSPPVASTGSPGTFTSQDIVGSGLHSPFGSLSATIAANGTVTLLQTGKPLRKLKSGRYTFTVVSHDPRSGFSIERTASHTVAVSRGAFTGKRSVSVSLTKGKWIFIATPGKASSSFVVA
jgi:hypothetical protein